MGYQMKIEYMTIMNRIRDNKCPVCGKDNVSYDSIDISLPHCSQKATCDNCDTEWKEFYLMHGIEITDIAYKYTIKEIEIRNDLSDVENIPEILGAILNMKKVLPALIGIDSELDKIIAERLKK